MAREDDAESADLAREQEREREWQQIVENYGERALLDAEDAEGVPPAAAEPAREPDAVDDPRGVRDQVDPADEFVPPTPPPVPRPSFDRLLAWLGVFGVPAVVLFCIVVGLSVPSWFGLLMAAGFLGGFGYLVLRMSDEPRDPWDDGAVL